MQLFVMFIFGVIVLGAGAMLSPAWPSAQPRIGLAAALSLALVAGGAVFWASAFGWDTLVIDYMLFALMSGVVLGGTLSQAQTRAEAKGEELSDQDQGWPGPHDLVFFGLVGLLALLPLWVLPAPIGGDAAELASQTFFTRAGDTFFTEAPFSLTTVEPRPPAFHALGAYLSEQLGQPIPAIQFAVSAVLLLLCVWVIYDLGAELQDKRLGRALALAALGSGLLLRVYLDAQYTALLGLLFLFSGLLYLLRYAAHGKTLDLVGAGLMLGAVAFADFRVLVVAFGVHLVVMIWRVAYIKRHGVVRWLLLTFGVPLVAIIATSPWLLSIASQNALPEIITLALDSGRILLYSALVAVTLFGGLLLLAAWERVPDALQNSLRNSAYIWLGALALLLALAMPLGAALWPDNAPADALTAGDVAALDWLRENSPDDAVVLTDPDYQNWLIGYGERAPALYRQGTGSLAAVWDSDNTSAWDAAGITHIYVPAASTRDFSADMGVTVAFEQGGASVYTVLDDASE